MPASRLTVVVTRRLPEAVETRMIELFDVELRDPDVAMSREELAKFCGVDSGERTIDVQVTRLRRKLEMDTKTPRYLQTVRGKGYLLRVEAS